MEKISLVAANENKQKDNFEHVRSAEVTYDDTLKGVINRENHAYDGVVANDREAGPNTVREGLENNLDGFGHTLSALLLQRNKITRNEEATDEFHKSLNDLAEHQRELREQIIEQQDAYLIERWNEMLNGFSIDLPDDRIYLEAVDDAIEVMLRRTINEQAAEDPSEKRSEGTHSSQELVAIRSELIDLDKRVGLFTSYLFINPLGTERVPKEFHNEAGKLFDDFYRLRDKVEQAEKTTLTEMFNNIVLSFQDTFIGINQTDIPQDVFLMLDNAAHAQLDIPDELFEDPEKDLFQQTLFTREEVKKTISDLLEACIQNTDELSLKRSEQTLVTLFGEIKKTAEADSMVGYSIMTDWDSAVNEAVANILINQSLSDEIRNFIQSLRDRIVFPD